MANENKTAELVRKQLRKLGYYDDENEIVVEEKISDSPRIDKLLKNASKKSGGTGKGFPEFIITSRTRSEFVIVIECKADTKKHQSKAGDKYKDYAVDGVLLYASYLSREFDVLAIAISGETTAEMRISHFLHLRDELKAVSFGAVDHIVPFDDYVDAFMHSEVKFKQDYGRLLDYTRGLNDQLHGAKIKEAHRSLLISGILIGLQNQAFKATYRSHKTAKQLAKYLLETIADEFTNAKLPQAKIDTLRQAYSFITSATTLINDKEFFIKLIDGIDDNVNGFMKTHKYYDTVGQFYVEFLRYANNEKGLGIVLTPPHIADLFVALGEVNKNSRVLDNCCGTAGLLIAAMRVMVEDAKGDKEIIKRIQENQLIGIEYQDDIFALAVSNMVVHGDGKTNIFQGDCFQLAKNIKEKFAPSVGILNPPYKSPKTTIEELEFILNNLESLEENGKCIAIVPISCAIALSGDAYEKKKTLLQRHTLEAVMSMPEALFHNSDVNVHTVVLVLTAHRPHPVGKKTWFGYWRNDGFIKQKARGRVDANNTWEQVKHSWLDAYRNRETIKGLSLMREVHPGDEWCPEAYLPTDYGHITKDLFKSYAQQYLAFRLQHNLLDFTVSHGGARKNAPPGVVPLTKLFKTASGVSKTTVDVTDAPSSEYDVRFIRPSQTYAGSVDGFVDSRIIDGECLFPPDVIYVSTDGQGSHTYSYVSSFNFVPNSNVSTLISLDDLSLEEKLYYSLCITVNRFRFSYGRKPKGDRLKNILLPSRPPEFVYSKVFQEILDRWKGILT